MSIHPETLVIEKKREQADEPLQSFYFQSKSGNVTTVKAKDKYNAIAIYKLNTLPALHIPRRSFLCGNKIYCSQSFCRNYHVLENNIRLGNYIDMFHLLFKAYPNCDILHRLKLMMEYSPTVMDDDYQVIQENPDGTQTKHNPATSVLHWKEANVILKFPHDCLYKISSRQSIFERIFPKFFEKKDGSYTYVYLNVCYDILYLNLDKLTSDQIDKISGSFEPTTEPPLRNEVVDAVGPVEVRQPSLFRRKRKQYEAIELTNIANW